MHKSVKYALALAAALLAGYVIYSYAADSPHIGPAGSTHIHMNWSVEINGVPVWLENPKYQLRSELVHMEDGTSQIHKHATGVTMGFFLQTIGWSLSKDYLELDDGSRYYAGNGKSLQFIVNGKPNYEYGRYDLRNGDVIGIIYG